MSVVVLNISLMAALTDLDVRILEFAERREQNPRLPIGQVITEFEVSPARYTQMLMHLVQNPRVVADPRWTGMAHRIQRVMTARTQLRASRSFQRAG
jgi:hypothetical protein